MWNQQRLEQMIADGVEESLTLDYKAAGAFAKQTQKREEIQKDVSAFSNSAGGTIIYGIKEHSSHDRKHLPERIDPIARDQYSKEWLEQIISGIQPRVHGVVIHPVQLASSTNDCCYVVEIPQSETVHQAPDGKYYRRYNFENRFMQDYEVREAMNRSKHPKIDASIELRKYASYEAWLEAQLYNSSDRIARHYRCDVTLPIWHESKILLPEQPFTWLRDATGVIASQFTIHQSKEGAPLFPKSSIIAGKLVLLPETDHPVYKMPLGDCATCASVTIYADEMPFVHLDYKIQDILKHT